MDSFRTFHRPVSQTCRPYVSTKRLVLPSAQRLPPSDCLHPLTSIGPTSECVHNSGYVRTPCGFWGCAYLTPSYVRNQHSARRRKSDKHVLGSWCEVRGRRINFGPYNEARSTKNQAPTTPSRTITNGPANLQDGIGRPKTAVELYSRDVPHVSRDWRSAAIDGASAGKRHSPTERRDRP